MWNTEKDFLIQLNQSYGNSFQDLFYRLMKEIHQDFIPVKPDGPFGDCGCDGYLSNSGVYFQVYGPESFGKTTLTYALKKMNEDFTKIFDFIKCNESFPKMTNYIFVFNNIRDSTMTMENSKKYEKLKKSFSDINFGIWDRQYLVELFLKLNSTQQANILCLYNKNNCIKEEFIKNIDNENIMSDIELIRKIKKDFSNLLNELNNNDFIVPFSIQVIEHIDKFKSVLENINFNSDEIEESKNNSLLYITNLLSMIIYYTKYINGKAVMKRIEPWGEITNENFEDVRDKILKIRENSYFSIKDLFEKEQLFLDSIR